MSAKPIIEIIKLNCVSFKINAQHFLWPVETTALNSTGPLSMLFTGLYHRVTHLEKTLFRQTVKYKCWWLIAEIKKKTSGYMGSVFHFGISQKATGFGTTQS